MDPIVYTRQDNRNGHTPNQYRAAMIPDTREGRRHAEEENKRLAKEIRHMTEDHWLWKWLTIPFLLLIIIAESWFYHLLTVPAVFWALVIGTGIYSVIKDRRKRKAVRRENEQLRQRGK